MKKIIPLVLTEIVLAVIAFFALHWVIDTKWHTVAKFGLISSITMCYVILGATSAVYWLGNRRDERD